MKPAQDRPIRARGCEPFSSREKLGETASAHVNGQLSRVLQITRNPRSRGDFGVCAGESGQSRTAWRSKMNSNLRYRVHTATCLSVTTPLRTGRLSDRQQTLLIAPSWRQNEPPRHQRLQVKPSRSAPFDYSLDNGRRHDHALSGQPGSCASPIRGLRPTHGSDRQARGASGPSVARPPTSIIPRPPPVR